MKVTIAERSAFNKIAAACPEGMEKDAVVLSTAVGTALWHLLPWLAMGGLTGANIYATRKGGQRFQEGLKTQREINRQQFRSGGAYALPGAAVGGAVGYGLGSLGSLWGSGDEDDEERKSRKRRATIIGSLVGGLGAGALGYKREGERLTEAVTG